MNYMKKIKVNLDSIDKVKKFNQIAFKQDFEIDVVSGRYNVDAKSLMGIFSLNLAEPITVVLHTDDEAKIDKVEKEFNELQ